MKRGFVIILVLATLVLLALLSLTYIKLALIDRNIARNYMDNKRAKLIAESGVEYAIARIQQDLTDTSWVALGDQKSITINGIPTKYTESSGSTYGENRDIFKVNVRDCNSMINVNDGLGNQRVTDNTKRILNVLGDVVGIDKVKLGWLPTEGLGDKIIEKRSTGYNSKQGLLKVVNNDLDEFKKFKDCVTTYAWQDPNVCNPVPLSSNVISAYAVYYNTGLNTALGTINVYRYGHGYDKNGNSIDAPLLFAPEPFADPNVDYLPTHGIYALDELNPQWIEIVSRSPVNINTAAKEVLIALLKDLKGFYPSDRRRNNPPTYTHYSYVNIEPLYALNYAPGPPYWDERGYLYITKEIDQDTATSIADGIIDKGNFRSWRQFSIFCDNLVEGVLKDTRPIFYEYGLDQLKDLNRLVPSEVARRQASQAMADVLKANFNPNLHLNETNPDANIKSASGGLVDKTDLIVNSTEFCFTPMGYFEIESEGLILKDDKVIARSKIDTLVNLYDAVRYTNEKHFLEDGILVEDKPGTHNSRALEIGPEGNKLTYEFTYEVIVGWKKVKGVPVPIKETRTETRTSYNEWGGYIALSTVNGPDPHPQATFYSHFSKDFNANYHADGPSYQPNITTSNVPDRTEQTAGVKGPYPYNLDYRLARSFRKESEINTLRAPCDLRIDGAYVERHAALAYGYSGASTAVFKNPGMFCYWIKPWFYPETTGNIRTFFSMSKSGGFWDSIFFTNYFFPSHWPDRIFSLEGDTLLYESGGTYKSTSLIFGYTTMDSSFFSPSSTWPYGGRGYSTPILNHLSHFNSSTGSPFSCHPTGISPKSNYLKSGQWIHVACMWNLPTASTALDVDQHSRIFINGAVAANSSVIPAHELTVTMDQLLVSTTFRIGEPSNGIDEDRARNWTSDSTVDEFYVFVPDSTAPDPVLDLADKVKVMYGRSRYYRLNSSPLYETSFISGILNLTKQQMNTPSNSTITAPSTSGPGSSILIPKTKIIGLSWTYYGESVDADGKPVIKNYKKWESVTDPVPLTVKLKVSILKDNVPVLGALDLDNDGYSPVNVEMDLAADYRYKVTFKINLTDPDNTVLLYSPIFDDITIYYTNGVKFLSYLCLD